MRALRPMLAASLPAGAAPPSGPGWVHEVKWDGMRVLADASGAGLLLHSRTGRDVSAAFPELAGLVGLGDALLDGEVVALGADGAPSFGVLQQRLVDLPGAALVARVPVAYVAFDVLRRGGRDLVGEALSVRREALDALAAAAAVLAPVSVSALHDDAAGLWTATRAAGLEGIVSKRADAPYQPGRRSPDWIKRTHRSRRTAVVGGWRPQVGRSSALGALLLGAPDASGGLRYLGRAGSGIAGARAEQLAALLAPLEVGASPFADDVPAIDAAGAHWCSPVLLVEVAHLGWTDGGRLRQPSILGVRTDASADPAPQPATEQAREHARRA